MDTSACEPIKIDYEACLRLKLDNFGNQKPDVSCEELFENYKTCYTVSNDISLQIYC